LDYLTTHTSLSLIRRGFAPGFVNYKQWCTRLATASDKAYQLLAHGRWFSPASSTTKTGRHDIAEILLKGALKHQKSNQIKSIWRYCRSNKIIVIKYGWIRFNWNIIFRLSRCNLSMNCFIQVILHWLRYTQQSVIHITSLLCHEDEIQYELSSRFLVFYLMQFKLIVIIFSSIHVGLICEWIISFM
jgi:hypothetical protein